MCVLYELTALETSNHAYDVPADVALIQVFVELSSGTGLMMSMGLPNAVIVRRTRR